MTNSIENRGTKSILLIDDDNWVHKLIAHFMEKNNYSTYSAYNPYDGIVMALNHKPDLILLDYIMPGINGDVLLKLFRKIEATKALPIVILSANIDKDFLREALSLGADGFISKPFTEQVLEEKINLAFEKNIHKMEPV